ncbi:hypothetical protein DPMN_163342 [Dreissena polymorpha]|uniref:Uncharacterized protein n=1 Tax=Dreissena polymorpha TaxID=45954 RepID=A0A9D4IUH8_DREPO|nr:hypothetical protein DPMN_163342 [Dreissena polymorpha]
MIVDGTTEDGPDNEETLASGCMIVDGTTEVRSDEQSSPVQGEEQRHSPFTQTPLTQPREVQLTCVQFTPTHPVGH